MGTSKEHMRRSAERIIALLDSDAPACLLASEVRLLWTSAMVVCGDRLFEEWGKW